MGHYTFHADASRLQDWAESDDLPKRFPMDLAVAVLVPVYATPRQPRKPRLILQLRRPFHSLTSDNKHLHIPRSSTLTRYYYGQV
jgi:hypothetical protein